MNTYIKIFLAIITLSVLSACEKTADIDIPDNNPELVVAAFLSPQDDSIRIKLSWTNPIYYTNNYYDVDYEDGATVVVSKGSSNYLLKYDDFQNYYISENVNFKVGDNLKLRITNGDDELIADCSLPVEPLYEVEYLGGSYRNTGGWKEYVHKVKLVCKNTQEFNYYRVTFQFQNEYSNSGYTNKEFLKMTNGESEVIYVQGDSDNMADSLFMNIINSDESYFRYHESVKNQNEGEGIFSEPGLIYNNIEGGLGIFGSYNQKKEIFILN